jgi:hypothetical protein
MADHEEKTGITRLTLSTKSSGEVKVKDIGEWSGEEAKEEYAQAHNLGSKEKKKLEAWCLGLTEEEIKNTFLYSWKNGTYRFPKSRSALFNFGKQVAVTPFKFTESELYARTHIQNDFDYGTEMFKKNYSNVEYASFTFFPYRDSDWQVSRKAKAYTQWNKESILKTVEAEYLDLTDEQARACFLTSRLWGTWAIKTDPMKNNVGEKWCILPPRLRKITLRDAISTPYEILKRRVLNQAIYYGSEWVKFNTEPDWKQY